MDNKDILILILVILLVYLFICNNNNENFSNKTFKNLDNFTNNNITIGQSIKNMGDLVNIIQSSNDLDINGVSLNVKNSGELPFTNNILFNKNVVGCSLYTIILWPKNTPPYPNTNPITRNGDQLSYTLSSTDCWYPCIGGTITIDEVEIVIPDMRGRMMVGYGSRSNHSRDQYVDNPGTHVGGELPLREHNHDLDDITGGAHRHNIPVAHGDQRDAYCRDNNCRAISYKVLHNTRQLINDNNNQLKITTNSSSHNHNININNTGYNSWNDSYSKRVIPHSTILQFWMRVR